MSRERADNFDLVAALAKPGFTPGQRDIAALVELVAGTDEKLASRASVAVVGLGDAARAAIVAKLGAGDDGARARLVGALGLLARAGDGAARARVIEAMRDAAPRVRRAAAGSLGKLGGDDSRAALLARWDASDATPDERRVLVEALGKLGGDDVLGRLRALDAANDAELARRRDRALLMADRDAKRDSNSSVAADVAPPSPVTVVLRCRPGLEPLLVEELTALGRAPRRGSAGNAEVVLAGPWSELFASRLWAAAAARLPGRATTNGALDPAAITRALVSPATRALLAAWTRGPIRWRLAFATGHKRAIVWRVARDVAALAPELVNDPTATTWDVIVDGDELLVMPRKLEDPRFAYRVADVPAASHPTVAAALVWVAGMRAGDRVWDPFCGSGVELVECARRSAVTLAGSDLDPTALDAARANLDAAGVTAQLAIADARTHASGPLDLIITNPPLGGRLRGDAAALLCEALPHFARQLAPGGRLVWITPVARRTTPVAERSGLRIARWLDVDLGGIRGRLERWERD